MYDYDYVYLCMPMHDLVCLCMTVYDCLNFEDLSQFVAKLFLNSSYHLCFEYFSLNYYCFQKVNSEETEGQLQVSKEGNPSASITNKLPSEKNTVDH